VLKLNMKIIKHFFETHILLCVRLHILFLTCPSSGLLTNQVWLHVGIPYMFTFNTVIFCLADECIKFKG
jgi:hypothetical protein